MNKPSLGCVNVYASLCGSTFFIVAYSSMASADRGIRLRRGVYPGATLFATTDIFPVAGDGAMLVDFIKRPTLRQFTIDHCGANVVVEGWRFSPDVYRIQTVNPVRHASGSTFIYGQGAEREEAIADLMRQLDYVVEWNAAPSQSASI